MSSTVKTLRVDRKQNVLSTTPAVWQETLVNVIDLKGSAARNRIAHELSDRFVQLNPGDDNETEIGIFLDSEDAAIAEQAFGLLDGARVEGFEYSVPVPVQGDSTADDSRGRQPRPPKNKTRPCECGCGEFTAGGKYLPGHDSRHHSQLLARSDEGDREAIDYLVSTGYRTVEQLDSRRAKFDKKRARARTDV